MLLPVIMVQTAGQEYTVHEPVVQLVLSHNNGLLVSLVQCMHERTGVQNMQKLLIFHIWTYLKQI